MADRRAADINGDEDEDEALRLAIALSLGQVPASTRQGHDETIDLTQSDEVASNSDHGADAKASTQPSLAVAQTSQEAPATVGADAAVCSVSNSMGFDRRQMEKDRLARLNKRKIADQSSPGSSRPAQRAKIYGDGPSPAPTFPLPTRVPEPPKLLAGGETDLSSQSLAPPPKSSALPFPHGIVKKTWAKGTQDSAMTSSSRKCCRGAAWSSLF